MKSLDALEADVRYAAVALATAKEKHATAFLLAKLSRKNPTDRQAEASADVEAGAEVIAAEANLFIAEELFAAAMLNRGEEV